MPRFKPLTTDNAGDQARPLLEAVESKLGMIPNIYATMANAPSVLEGVLGLGKSLGKGELSAALREQIALAVAGANKCDYCAAAHTAVGKMLKVDPGELQQNLAGSAGDAKTAAALTFAIALVKSQGFVSDEQVQAVRDAGYSDAQIIEIFGEVVKNIITNYFNHMNQTTVDFPAVDLP